MAEAEMDIDMGVTQMDDAEIRDILRIIDGKERKMSYEASHVLFE